MTITRVVVSVGIGFSVGVGAATGLAAPALATPPSSTTPGTPAQVWHQAFQRGAQDAPCVAPTELDIAWLPTWDQAENHWTRSWEEWANGGTGGWTCTRSITWAPGSPSVVTYIL